MLHALHSSQGGGVVDSQAIPNSNEGWGIMKKNLRQFLRHVMTYDTTYNMTYDMA